MLVAQNGPSPVMLVMLLVLLLPLFGVGIILLRFGGLWLQSYMSGAYLSLLQIVLMSYRKVDARVVVRALVKARQSGVELSGRDLEQAYLQGADIDKLTLAMICAKKQGLDITFQELVDAELNDQLAEKLDLGRDRVHESW